MSLMQLLKQAAVEGGIERLGARFGMQPDMTRALAGQLAPAIAGGARRRAQESGGLSALLGSLEGEAQTRFLGAPEQAATPEALLEGEAFLAATIGSQDVARRVSDAAAARVGAPADAAASFLPALAALMQGAMQRGAPDAEIGAARGALTSQADGAGFGIGDLLSGAGGGLGGILSGLGGGGGGLGGMIGGLAGGLTSGGSSASDGSGDGGGFGLGGILRLLDRDGDGSVLDDVIGMATGR